MSDPTKDDYLFSDKSKFAKELLKNDDYLKCISSISEVKNVFKTNYPKKKFKFIIGDVKDTLKKNPKKYFFITTRYRLV